MMLQMNILVSSSSRTYPPAHEHVGEGRLACIRTAHDREFNTTRSRVIIGGEA